MYIAPKSPYKTPAPVGQNLSSNHQMKAPLSPGGARGAGGEWGEQTSYVSNNSSQKLLHII